MKSFKLERNNSMEYYTATEKIEKDLDVLHAKILKILWLHFFEKKSRTTKLRAGAGRVPAISCSPMFSMFMSDFYS